MSEIPRTREFKTFNYPDQRTLPAHRMCAAGQRRAALEGLSLFLPGAVRDKNTVLNTAYFTDISLRRGADTNKHNLILFVVTDLYTQGLLEQFVDRDGNYTLELHDGTRIPSNVWNDIETSKRIY